MKWALSLGFVALALVLSQGIVEADGVKSTPQNQPKQKSGSPVSKAIQKTLKSRSPATRGSSRGDGRAAVTYTIDVYYSRGAIQNYLKSYHWTVFYNEDGQIVSYNDYGAKADYDAMVADGYTETHSEPVVESVNAW